MAFADLINKINALQQELASLQPLPADRQEKLDRKFRLEFNYNSNHIEGNTLNYGETELYLIFDKTTGDHSGREYEEMKASDAALRKIQEYAKDKEQPLSEYFIKNLHELILVRPYWADAITPSGQPTRREIKVGQYKSQPNSVKLQNGEMFHYASPEETPAQMGDLIQWYRDELGKKELHPVALAALLHYRFVRIHPFDDGNGRMSRLLMNYVLYAHGFPPVIVKSADKKNYLNSLNKADTGNIDAFVEYIGEQMIWSLETSVKAANGESVEETDDIDKEIELWKKELQHIIPQDIKWKSELTISHIYFNDLSPFLTLFEKKISLYKNMFASWQQTIYVNDKKVQQQDIYSLNQHFSLPSIKFLKEPSLNKLDELQFGIDMYGFKKDLVNHFDFSINLKIDLRKYDYELIIWSNTNASNIKTRSYVIQYNDSFTKEKQIEIVNNVTSDILIYFKSKMSN